ncbi:MAG: hypothetical protein ABR607_10240 [Pyrinomonadaceae bacterium]
MKSGKKIISSALVALFLAASLAAQPRTGLPATTSQEVSSLQAKTKRFAPTVMLVSLRGLSVNDRRALQKIIRAAAYLDRLFLRQLSSRNEDLWSKLKADQSPLGKLRLHYFMINKGPWSQLDDNEAFIAGVLPRPPQADFYPLDMTKDEFNSWLSTLSAEDKEKATGYFYVIRRDQTGKLKAVPYSTEYGDILNSVGTLLRDAAALTTNPSLKDFLRKRAAAFSSNDYYESDVAWMDLDSPIDVTIGPYETYEDELFGYKAAFEAYVTLRDSAETAKLRKFSQYLQELEDHLPIDPKYRNPKLGAASPIRVVNEVFSSGEGNSGVQTAAFNLPNDERVVKEKGSKRIMLKNVQQAKFNKTLIPISRVVLSPAQLADISFDAFFTHILTHELMHGLGPHNINVAGHPTTVRLQLKDRYSSIEEAKADVTGLWALQYLIDKGVVDRGMQRTLYTTYLASMFRSVRFGITEAHGRGVAMQFNYFTDEGAIKYDEGTGKFSVDESRIREAVRKLTNELLTIEAEGSYEKANAILEKYAVIRPPMKAAFDKLKNVPVDIEPIFPLAR